MHSTKYNAGVDSPQTSAQSIIILSVEENFPGKLHFSHLIKVHASKLGDGDMFAIQTTINAKDTITKLNLDGAVSTSGDMD